ncbi:MAG: glycosyltransferase family 25 protein [Arcicella sp.]|jgi:glycosyl transferase family 25|nr:glycosyltransferase family 25 protein [Arcicella sp.]
MNNESVINISKVYVAHVKKGYDNRRVSIESQMNKLNIPFEFMLDGDIEDLNQDRLEKYFKGHLKALTPQTSCMMKHLLIYEDMIKNNVSAALVFEDDILLADNFVEIFNKSISELHSRADIDFNKSLISYENSTLKDVSILEIKSNQYLYLRSSGRCAGAYYISLNSAKLIINKCEEEKTDEMMDWYHNQMVEAGLLNIYWCHPTIAEQGSQNGVFDSSLDIRKKGNFKRRVSWLFKKMFSFIRF